MNTGNVQLASEEQLDELRIAVQKSVNKMRGRIDAATAQAWIGTSGALGTFAEQLLTPPVVKSEPITRLLNGGELMLPATTGDRTIAKAIAIFAGYIDPNFTNWELDVLAAATAKTCIEVHEMVCDANFKTIFAGNTKRFTQDQVIAFVETYANWLHPQGWATLLPFTVDGKDFVARVSRYSDGGLKVYVFRFSNDYVWDAEYRYRVVFPQLSASTTLP